MRKRMGRWVAFALVLALVGSGCSIQLDLGLPGSGGESSPAAGAGPDDPGSGGSPAEGESGAGAEWEGLYPVYQLAQGGKRWGYIDRTGSFVIPPQFESAAAFQPTGLALVVQGDRSGLINAKGEWVYSGTGIYAAVGSEDGIVLDSTSGSTLLDASGTLLFEAEWISDAFSDGLAPFQRDGLYGYVDSTGRVVIEPAFARAEPFSDGLALVKLPDGRFAVINPDGQQVRDLGNDWVDSLGEGMYAYQDAATELWGYRSVSGEVEIAPQFREAGRFADGLAIVSVGDDWFSALRGVIDREGNFVIPPAYESIQYLGEGLYAVAKDVEGFGQSYFLQYAIFSAGGRQLTDFRYYDVSLTPYGISVSDGRETYFLRRSGERDFSLPSAEGRGRMYPVNDLIAVEVDGALRYVTLDGRTVWEASLSMPLAGGGEVRAEKHRAGPFVLIRYPQVAGLPNQEAQERINQRLYEAFVSAQVPGTGGDWVSVEVDYTAQQIGRILVVRLDGYWYPAGAAHGMPLKEYLHFDLDTGAEYGLPDLFKPGSAYQARLEQLVAERIAREQLDLFVPNPSVEPDHYFAAAVEGLILYWYPYDIGPYAAGFPTFLIPWEDVRDLIDRDGAFWRGLEL